MSEPSAKLIRDYGLTIVTAVLVAFAIRFCLIESYRIPTASMRPTLIPGDVIFVSKAAFGLRLPGADRPLTGERAPKRGEVVLYSPPQDPERDYIKRVIALPGETVQIKDGELSINSQKVLAPRDQACGVEKLASTASGLIEHSICSEPPAMENFGPEKVPDGSVFVLGDLRTGGPARGAGIVPVTAIKGKALWIWLSIAPPTFETASRWYPQFQFERMFRRIE